jgi:hypothetical protein
MGLGVLFSSQQLWIVESFGFEFVEIGVEMHEILKVKV